MFPNYFTVWINVPYFCLANELNQFVKQMNNKLKQSTTQLQQALECLNTLRLNITPEDRRAVRQQYGFTGVTVSNYLRGKGSNLDTALVLIRFFSARIQQRAEILNAA